MNVYRNGCYFLIIVLVFNILIVDSKLKFKYPTAITLANKNIFVIEENGIHICNPDFSSITKTIESFNTEEDKISNTDKLSTVIVHRRDDYIISLINYKAYFFETNGEYIYNTEKLIKDYNATSLSLIPIYSSFFSGLSYVDYVFSYFDSEDKIKFIIL